MNNTFRDHALQLLRQALNNYNANFRDGQRKAIAELIRNRSKLLVVQRMGWGKSLVYFLATRLQGGEPMTYLFNFRIHVFYG